MSNQRITVIGWRHKPLVNGGTVTHVYCYPFLPHLMIMALKAPRRIPVGRVLREGLWLQGDRKVGGGRDNTSNFLVFLSLVGFIVCVQVMPFKLVPTTGKSWSKSWMFCWTQVRIVCRPISLLDLYVLTSIIYMSMFKYITCILRYTLLKVQQVNSARCADLFQLPF